MINKNSVISIVGGSGFVGTCIAKHLASIGCRIKIISRFASATAKKTMVAGYVGQTAFIDCDIHDTKALEKAIRGSDVVINCIGVLYSKGKQSFEALHHKHVKHLVDICKKEGVKKLVHISALGAGRVLTSTYAKSKLDGEKEIINSGLEYTIFRPSVIFGAGDSFINFFALIARYSPIIPIIGAGKNKFQPIYVDDLALAVLRSLTSHVAESKNQCLEVGGPKVYEMSNLIDLILNTMHAKRLKLHIPIPLAKLKAFFWELLPKPIITRDQIELLRYDNILLAKNDLELFDISPKSLESVIGTYIS